MDVSIEVNLLLGRSGASGEGLGVELRSGIVADHLSRLVTRRHQRLVSGG